MEKKKVRATRTNGRKDSNGVFKAGHNDRSFNLENAEHVDADRSKWNVYWDYLQGYNLADENGVRPERQFFFIALKNTFIILIGITITILPLSFIVALLLEKPFRGSGVVQSMIFAPNVIAPILVGLIWLFILDPKMGMINAILRSIGLSDYQQQWIGGKTLTPYSVAFVYLWQVLGFYTTINMAGLRSIPADIYEAAEIDGANYFQRIRKITIPMMKNTIVINTILIITGGFKIFETVKQLTNGGPNHMSDVLVTYMYDTTFTSSRYGYGMAVATVSFVLCLIFSIIYLVNVGKSLEQKEG